MAKKQATSCVESNDDDWEEIKKEITCPICYELFTDPRTLPCLHTFCKSCIQRSVDTGLAEVPEGYFECPLCRAHVPLPAKGIDGISANFSIKRLIEIYSKRQEIVTDTAPKCRLCTSSNPATMWCIECDCTICSECSDVHKRMKMFAQHQVIPMQEFNSDPKRAIKVFLNPGVCSAHPDQVLKFYCYTCDQTKDQTICVECALLKHRDHKFDSIANVVMEEKEEVLKTAAALEPMRDKVSEAMNRIAASKDDITDNHLVNVKQVNSLFDELHQILEQQREVMLKKLESFKTTSHKSLDLQNDNLAFLESKLKSCREFVLNLMDNGSANEILSFKSQIADRVNDLTGLMERAPLEPVCTADTTVWCIDSTKFVTMCQSVCHMFCSPDLPNCVVNKPTRHYIDDGVKPVNAVSVTLSLQDRHGNAVIGQCEHLEIASALVSHVTVKEQDEVGVYKITYQPVSIQADDVMIKWNGRDIIQCNVPALMRDYTTLRVARPVEKSDDENPIASDDENPIASDDENPIASDDEKPIASDDENPIASDDENPIANDDEKPIASDDEKPIASDDENPIANDDENPIANDDENPIANDDEKPIASDDEKPIVSDDENPIANDDEKPIANDDENLIASDDEEDIGKGKLDNKLKTLTSYGPDGMEFGRAFGLCNGPHDELIVADCDNNQLIVFDKDLQYSHTIGETGENEGKFFSPTGIACDKAGQLFVVDSGNNRVQVFKLSGEFVTTFGTEGSGDGEFSQPYGLALSSTGRLIVCDTGNKRVQVFDTQQNHQFQYNFAQGKVIIDLTINATEDKLFAVDGMCILAYTPQGQFLYSIAVDPVHCGIAPRSICSTLDGHLLVGTLVSSVFLSVYHENGTLVCGGGGNDAIFKWVVDNEVPDYGYGIHVTSDGVIVAFCESCDGSIFDTQYGAVIL